MFEKWVSLWLTDDFRTDWQMTSAQTNKWGSHRHVCVRNSFVCLYEGHSSKSAEVKKIAHGAKKSHFYWQPHPTVVTLHRFSLFTPPKTNFIMPILVRKAKMRLTYREEKPEVHVVRHLTYPKVTGKQLVQYAPNVVSVFGDLIWNMHPVCLRRLANALNVGASARGHHDSSVL